MASVFSDDFNRANESLNASANWADGENSSSSTWGNAEWRVTSNELEGGSSGGTPSTCQTTTTGHAAIADCRVTIGRVTGSGFDGGPTARVTATNTYYYMDVFSTSNIDVYRRISGSDTLIGSRNQTHTSGDTYSLEVSGTGATVTLKVIRNGTQVGTDLTDTNASRITSAGQTGVLNWVNVKYLYDNFDVDDLAAGGGRTTKNTRAFPLGMEIGMGWVMNNQV